MYSDAFYNKYIKLTNLSIFQTQSNAFCRVSAVMNPLFHIHTTRTSFHPGLSVDTEGLSILHGQSLHGQSLHGQNLHDRFFQGCRRTRGFWALFEVQSGRDRGGRGLGWGGGVGGLVTMREKSMSNPQVCVHEVF